MRRFIFIILLLAATGCNPAKKFSVVDAGMPILNGLASLHGKATVENVGSRDFIIESAVFIVRYRDRELGSARLMLPIEIPAGRRTAIRYDFILENVSLSSMQTLQSRIVSNPAAFTVDAGGWIRWGGLRKKIEMKDVPLDHIMGIIFTFVK